MENSARDAPVSAGPPIRDAIARLQGAYATRQTIAPLSETDPSLTAADAYAIQQAQVQTWQAGGRQIAGHKVGLTSAAVQAQLGVDSPDYGHLMADTVYPTGRRLPIANYLQPRIEPEIAFVLRNDLSGPNVTTARALRAIDFALAALEIVDSRIADWRITLVDTIADNASCGAVVLGSIPVEVGAIDLRLTGVNMYANGRIAHSGAGAAALGDPIAALVWLANTLGERGTGLKAGSVVLSGALTPMLPVKPGDTFQATFNQLGSVSATFTTGAGK